MFGVSLVILQELLFCKGSDTSFFPHVHVFTHKMLCLFSLQRHKQNLSDRDKAIVDLAKEFDFRGTGKTDD